MNVEEEVERLKEEIRRLGVAQDDGSYKINGVGVLRIFVVDGDHCPYVMCLPTVKTIMSLRNWGVFSPPFEADVKIAVTSISAYSILQNMLIREDS